MSSRRIYNVVVVAVGGGGGEMFGVFEVVPFVNIGDNVIVQDNSAMRKKCRVWVGNVELIIQIRIFRFGKKLDGELLSSSLSSKRFTSESYWLLLS